jgi:hypothetical protein
VEPELLQTATFKFLRENFFLLVSAWTAKEVMKRTVSTASHSGTLIQALRVSGVRTLAKPVSLEQSKYAKFA